RRRCGPRRAPPPPLGAPAGERDVSPFVLDRRDEAGPTPPAQPWTSPPSGRHRCRPDAPSGADRTRDHACRSGRLTPSVICSCSSPECGLLRCWLSLLVDGVSRSGSMHSMTSWNAESASKVSVYDAFAECLKAVANGRRLELLELMAQGEHSVEELARLTGLAMTTTSNHLQTLKRAGLVSTRREGSTIFYRLGGDDVAELYAA